MAVSRGFLVLNIPPIFHRRSSPLEAKHNASTLRFAPELLRNGKWQRSVK